MKKDYKVLSTSTVQGLEVQVKACLTNGYVCLGGVQVIHLHNEMFFYQSMILEEKKGF